MAEKRMFAKSILNSDVFLDLPAKSQNLYFHLCMDADDDGFVNSPKRIQRTVGAESTDFEALTEKAFIIPFDSGICVIRHWLVHNCIQKDRYKKTVYSTEREQLSVGSDKVYNISDTDCLQSVSEVDTQIRLVKNSIEKNSKEFITPTFQEICDYCNTRNNNIDPQQFLDYYNANGWKVGRNSILN